ncbi:MAG TPA: class I tRNA ligase family protein [Spirochaetia bacterium]|nr:class I tRNA ligase family protein [Spirochaetia bacterium]
MSRAKETFKPRDEREVKIFTCGPSTYRRPHIGNYRTFLYEDVLVRYLTYKGHKVNRVINFTDVEDKTISEAKDRKRVMKEITDDVARHFHSECKLLKIMLPDKIPTGATSVEQAAKIIKELLKKGYAYWDDGDVFFQPLKVKNFGKLYRLDMSKWPENPVKYRKDTYNGNRWNRGDFVLWHGYRDGDIASWDTEIGKGRPSWNIQDPAMITENLGYQVDINCGGIDNIYRHHDYNIAIIESLSGKTYANFYMHGEHLIVDGKKMSKSHGNILYPDELIKDEKFKPEHLRFFLTATNHYRKKLNFTREVCRKRAEVLDQFHAALGSLLSKSSGKRSASPAEKDPEIEKKLRAEIGSVTSEFERCMEEDLDVPAAFNAVSGVVKKLAGLTGGKPLSSSLAEELESQIKRVDQVFGVLL